MVTGRKCKSPKAGRRRTVASAKATQLPGSPVFCRPDSADVQQHVKTLEETTVARPIPVEQITGKSRDAKGDMVNDIKPDLGLCRLPL